MLLKTPFFAEPTESTFDSFWPSVAERIDGAPPGEAKPGNGGGTASEDGEIVFKSSAAMQVLNIPERPAPPVASKPGALPPEPASSPWRWPVALMFSTAILVAGFIAYKKLVEPPPSQQVALATPGGEARLSPVESPSSAPASQPVAVAMAAVTEAGAPAATDGGAPSMSAEDKRPRVAVSAKRRAKAGKGGKAAVDEPPPEAKAEKKAEPAVAKPAARGKGKDDLDNLIDTAIGSEGKAAAKAKKSAASPAPAPGSNLPEQLTMNEISTGMGKIKGLVQACYDQYQVEGMAKVNFTIGGDGTVKDVAIKGKFFGTDTGTCVAGAVKKARFPKFSGKKMTIAGYPFQLQ